MMPGGIFPIILLSVIFDFIAGWKYLMTQGFLTLRPLMSMMERLEFVLRDMASSRRPYSSETSLFLEMFKLSIPLLKDNCLAKSINPVSENAFLLISRTLTEEFSFKNLLRAEMPGLLILFKLKLSS